MLVSLVGLSHLLRRSDAKEVSALVHESELTDAVVGIDRRHEAATRLRIGGNADPLPLGVKGVGVGDTHVAGVVGRQRVDVRCFPEVEFDRPAPDDDVAVGLGRSTARLEAQPLVELERLPEIAARQDRDCVFADAPSLT